MDKLTTISATLFMAADVFAIVSLALPDWIITEEAGRVIKNQLGFTLYGYENNNKMLFVYCRGYTSWSNVDLHDTVQPTTSLLYPRLATGMANSTCLHLHWLHLHHHDRNTTCLQYLGSQCYSLCPLGRICSYGTILPGSRCLSTRLSHRRDRRAGISATEYL